MIAIGVQGSGAYLYQIENNTWDKLGIKAVESGEIFSIEFAGNLGDTIYVAASQTGLFRSDDFNISWNQITLPTMNDVDITVDRFAVDINEQVIIGSNHNGLYAIEKAMQLSNSIDSPVDTGPGDNTTPVDDTSGSGGFGVLTLLLSGLITIFRCKHYLSRKRIFNPQSSQLG
jgi:hypothetical protein